MKRVIVLLVLLSHLLSSCVNEIDDFDVLGIKSSIVDESYIYPVGGPDYESALQLKNSGLELLGTKTLDQDKQELTLSDFLEGDEALFPVYPKDLTYFELVPYPSLKEDSIGLHFVSNDVSHYIDSLLGDSEQYHVVEQSWNYRGQDIKTLSLYTIDDELVYDNILFNMININKIRYDSNRRRMLSRSEGPYYGNGSAIDYVGFVNRVGTVVSESWVWWEEYGHMQSEPIRDGRTGEIISLCYHYVHDYLDHDGNTYVYNDYLTAINIFEDYSTYNAGRFSYCIWAGPTSYYQDDRLSIQLNFAYPFQPNNYYDYTRIINDGSSWTSCTIYGRFLSTEICPASYIVDY